VHIGCLQHLISRYDPAVTRVVDRLEAMWTTRQLYSLLSVGWQCLEHALRVMAWLMIPVFIALDWVVQRLPARWRRGELDFISRVRIFVKPLPVQEEGDDGSDGAAARWLMVDDRRAPHVHEPLRSPDYDDIVRRLQQHEREAADVIAAGGDAPEPSSAPAPKCAYRMTSELINQAADRLKRYGICILQGDILTQATLDYCWTQVPSPTDPAGTHEEGRTHKPVLDRTFRRWGRRMFWEPILEQYAAHLNDKFYIQAPVMIVSWRGSMAQPWHRDFGKAAVLIPLIDLPAAVGPTQVVINSHRWFLPRLPVCGEHTGALARLWNFAREWYHELFGTLVASAPFRYIAAWFNVAAVRALVPAGTVIMFDCNLVHRGLPNESAVHRPILSFDYM